MAAQSKNPAWRSTGRDLAKAIFAAGGVAAAFGVASCCALPIALSLMGISAASLVGVGYLAAQYQTELFYAAVLMLSAAAFTMWRQHRTRACDASSACSHPFFDWGSKLALVLAVGLLALTFWIEPPI